MTLSDFIATFPESGRYAALIGVVIGSLLSAFFGFRLFKLSLVISFGAAGFALGYSNLGLMLGDRGADLGFDVPFVLAILCAVILALLAVWLYKVMIYLCGGMFGFLIGFVIPYAIITLFADEVIGGVVGIILGIILAIVFAKEFMKMMKYIIIIETSLNGMALAFEGLAMLLVTNDIVITVASVIGLFVGILAIKYQVKANEGRALFEKN